ncbi:MAG: DNA-processing protein DprA [Propionibacteriaceae bacterium]|jgi:DNA processing protein|nr:DNA-processing protein DprA [Propionibacteriaceae bacterium]
MALTCCVEPATPQIAEAVAAYGAEVVWEAVLGGQGAVSRRAEKVDLDAVQRSAERAGARFVIPGDAEWPDRLADLAGCEQVNGMGGQPIGLWARGNGDLGQLCRDCVAMVGSRSSTAYGERVASTMACDLGEAGACVVSGGAYGIDAASHRGCLASRTPTVAVMAGGVDCAYPPTHARLFDAIAERGVLVAELAPGDHPTRVRFLGRNRLIAALAPGVVVVEAGVRSGARNTLNWANALGRVTMAVPGPVESAMSYGCHQAIREAAAVLVSNAAEVRELLGPLGVETPRPASRRRLTDTLTAEEFKVYEALPARGGRSADEVSLRAELPLGRTLGLLSQLADRDLAEQTESLQWRIARG